MPWQCLNFWFIAASCFYITENSWTKRPKLLYTRETGYTIVHMYRSIEGETNNVENNATNTRGVAKVVRRITKQVMPWEIAFPVIFANISFDTERYYRLLIEIICVLICSLVSFSLVRMKKACIYTSILSMHIRIYISILIRLI